MKEVNKAHVRKDVLCVLCGCSLEENGVERYSVELTHHKAEIIKKVAWLEVLEIVEIAVYCKKCVPFTMKSKANVVTKEMKK